MRVTQAFRFELDPNRAARVELAKHVGAARFAYDWGLCRCLEALEQGRPLASAVQLLKEWNRWKREHAPWWAEVSKCAPQEALRDLERAFRHWQQGRAGRPRFKRKKSFDDNTARFAGSIRVQTRAAAPRRQGAHQGASSKRCRPRARRASSWPPWVREADRWYVSLTCEVEWSDPPLRHGEPDGADVGFASFLVLSDGTLVVAPKPLFRALRLLRRRSRQLSRKQPGSRNNAKAALRLARLHRRDFLHKITTWLAKTKPVIVVEDLWVSGLLKNPPLARQIADVGWGEFRRMLAYKIRRAKKLLYAWIVSFGGCWRTRPCGTVRRLY